MFHHENASGPQALPQEDAEEDSVDAKPRSGTNPSTLLPPEDQEVASDEEDVKESGPVESRDCRLRAGRLRIPKDTIYAYIYAVCEEPFAIGMPPLSYYLEMWQKNLCRMAKFRSRNLVGGSMRRVQRSPNTKAGGLCLTGSQGCKSTVYQKPKRIE